MEAQSFEGLEICLGEAAAVALKYFTQGVAPWALADISRGGVAAWPARASKLSIPHAETRCVQLGEHARQSVPFRPAESLVRVMNGGQ